MHKPTHIQMHVHTHILYIPHTYVCRIKPWWIGSSWPICLSFNPPTTIILDDLLQCIATDWHFLHQNSLWQQFTTLLCYTVHTCIRIHPHTNRLAGGICLDYHTMIQSRQPWRHHSMLPGGDSVTTSQTFRCSISRASRNRLARWHWGRCRRHQVRCRSSASWPHAREWYDGRVPPKLVCIHLQKVYNY